jgi:uncharacterized protein (DUF433 family)
MGYHGDHDEASNVSQPSNLVRSDPEILGGTPVFAGTRVPVHNFIEYLEAGDSLDAFLDDFPSVTREQALAALDLARKALEASARPAR